MTEPEVLNDHLKLTTFNQQLEAAHHQQEQLLEDWEASSIALEEAQSSL